MVPFPITAAAAAPATAAAFPDGFTARCANGKETSAMFVDSDPGHPRLRQQDADPYTITIRRTHGHFEIALNGVDFTVVQAASKEFQLRVLKAEAGDLALSVETDTWGRSLSVYHLRYVGDAGALTMTETSYYGYGSDATTLLVMTCKIGIRPSSQSGFGDGR